ncbi:SDR family NAD(P)-dependent oxidoreductase [Pseudomaricurvus sp.]|uniref:SDR family NAD(P)-dependent oxidoreductase n=1 Tax=Pseudomaricurvus sp. TaxID=2004510 RepID=UPI003F6D7938
MSRFDDQSIKSEAELPVWLVIGAGGGIGHAVVQQGLAAGHPVIAVSRQPIGLSHPALMELRGAEDEDGINQVVEELKTFRGRIGRVMVCTGTLHSTDHPQLPEKRLENLGEASMSATFHTNTILPALWAAKLLPVLKGQQSCIYATLSARVGSIGDNRLGGWYSYRSSKAALNMLLKTTAIEYARRASNVKFVLFHPGTTDTPLSKPFQANVPAEKLFTPEFVANCLDRVMDSLKPDGLIDYLDWQGKAIDW